MRSQVQGFRPQFTGHETFPLRYGWLKKVFDAVENCKNNDEIKRVFLAHDATARFGVGKNMVASMRHWGKSTDIFQEEQGCTKFGDMLFGRNGLDPYMENSATLWLLHWKLAGNALKATWYWSFNVFAGSTFERETLIKGLQKFSIEKGWKPVSTNTIKRDVECFVRTYVARKFPHENCYEDVLESPLTELGLIRNIGSRNEFQFIRGPKVTLGDGILAYAICDYWTKMQVGNVLSFESVVYEAGSPGRVFLLNEDSLAERLSKIEDITNGEIRWSETAGLRQLIRTTKFSENFKWNLIRNEYRKPTF